ncbi:MAG: hypothetical protein M0008_02810 [Actinomycetota bacterium]|nr:hypothetical protein [Actinomycetota bacterium]
MASNDFEELDVLCDRMVVFRRSGTTEELCGDAVSEDAIGQMCQVSA